MYHFNEETQQIGKCQAVKKPCPFGGSEFHFENKRDSEKFLS